MRKSVPIHYSLEWHMVDHGDGFVGQQSMHVTHWSCFLRTSLTEMCEGYYTSWMEHTIVQVFKMEIP